MTLRLIPPRVRVNHLSRLALTATLTVLSGMGKAPGAIPELLHYEKIQHRT